jgi:hypothetical protein
MASKTVPAKKKSATSADKSTNPKEPSITIIKKSTCKNLQGKATLGYHLGIDEAGAIHWKIHSNSGAGMFSNRWVKLADIQKALADWPEHMPITSMTLRPLLTGSVNTASFLLATLVHTGVVEPVPDKKRHYQLGDAKPFQAEMDKLKGSHSRAGKAKPKAKATAGSRMSKGKAKPATGK